MGAHLLWEAFFPLHGLRQGVQQGDPLGPLLFALAWQRAIEALPKECLFNVWYLDDGHIVAPSAMMHQIVTTLMQECASMGIQLNTAKSCIWGPGLVTGPDGSCILPLSVPADSPVRLLRTEQFVPGSGLKVLGTPVEHPLSTTYRRTVLQDLIDKLEEACQLLSNVGDPQTQHTLQRFCLDACKLQHLLRSMDMSAFPEEVERATAILRDTFSVTLGCPVDDSQWFQATIPLRLGGLGIKGLASGRICARIASVANFLVKASELGFPAETVVAPPDFRACLRDAQRWVGGSFEPVEKWLTSGAITDIMNEHRSQRWWSDCVHKAMWAALRSQGTVRDQCRLQLQGMTSSMAWLSPPPGEGMGSSFTGREYRLLLRWHLGVPLLVPELGGRPCPRCGASNDVYGDHLVCCKRNGVTARHNAIRDALADVLQENGIPVQKEVGLGAFCDVESGERPADLLLPVFNAAGPLAVDILAPHPLAPSKPRDPSTVAAGFKRQENLKNTLYEAKCHEIGWSFSPLALHLWGGYGPQGGALMNKLIRHIVGQSHTNKATQTIPCGLRSVPRNGTDQVGGAGRAVAADCPRTRA